MVTDSVREKSVLSGVDSWASYYRANPHRFAEDYLNVHLRLFQKILLYMMNLSNFFCYIAARGFMASPHSNMRAIIGQNR